MRTQKYFDYIKKILKDECFVNKEMIIKKYCYMDVSDISSDYWIFDIKSKIFDTAFIDAVSNIFWEKFKDKQELQIGGLETTSIALVQALVLKGNELGKNISGFYIRKSRNKHGLHKQIEGEIYANREVVIVDDLINSSHSFERCIKVLLDESIKTNYVFAILRFRDEEYYTNFLKKNNIIKMHTIFDLNDLNINNNGKSLKNVYKKESISSFNSMNINWVFKFKKASFSTVFNKSQPIIDEYSVYFGIDLGYMVAIDKRAGSLKWKFKVPSLKRNKMLLSSPKIYKNMIIFGAYDGNVYALDKDTGKRIWTYYEADWIGSSPDTYEKSGLCFIGLEFGLIKKRGGIAAIDINTGKEVWKYILPALTHSSPLFIEKHGQVVIGSNDGCAYLFNAKNGNLIWKYETEKAKLYNINDGFGQGDIKEGFVYYEPKDLLCFGSQDGNLYIVSRKDKKLYASFKTLFGIFATPTIHKQYVIFSSADKYIYCFDIEKKELKWKFLTNGRIFAQPVVFGDRVYCGSNGGILYEIDIQNGTQTGQIIFSERITNSPIYDKELNVYFIPTAANELFSISKK